jgi:hypothetical protein
VVAGVADLILLVPSRGYSSLCIEMKTGSKSSRQSDNQKLWQVAAEKAGNKYVICRNFPDFEHEIKDYINFAKLKEK